MPILVGAGAIFLVLSLANSLTIGWIEHDDWPFLLDKSDHFIRKTLEEGRWLNYWWSKVSFRVLTPQSALVTFWLLVIVLTSALLLALRAASDAAFSLLAFIVVATSVSVLDLSQWPATLIGGLGVTAIGAYGVLVAPSRVWRLAVLFVFATAAFQSYPAFSFILFLVALARSDDQGVWDAVMLTVVVVAAVAASTLIAFAANYWSHGVFGVVLAGWRNPQYASDWTSLAANLRRGLSNLFELAKADICLSVLALIGLVCSLLARDVGRCLRYLMGLGVPIAFELAIAGYTGALSPERAFAWFGFFVVLATRWLFGKAPRIFCLLAIGLQVISGGAVAARYVESKAPSSAIADEAYYLGIRNRTTKVFVLGPYTNEKGRAAYQLRYRGVDARICAWERRCEIETHPVSGIWYSANPSAVIINLP